MLTENNLKNSNEMARINYRIVGTAIIGQCARVKDCRAEILSSYGPAKFEWWSNDGKRSGNAWAVNKKNKGD